MQSYCIIHPQSQLDSKFQYDSTQVKIEVPSSDSSGDPYDDSGMSAGTGEEDVIAFDYVFPPKTSQEQIFQEIARGHVRNALQSFQSAMFIASGASGSGKTFAVTGGAQRFSDRGLIPRSVSALFEALAAEPEREDVEVSVSFYELYKDAVVDLLSERRRKVPIKATENGPQLIGLLRQVVATESDAYHLLFQGDSNRHFQSFAQNSETSRGHVFYLLHITQRFTGKRAVLAFVDLAAPIAVRNPANTAIAQSLDALKATLLALRDGREAFWESAILPQLLEPWLGPKSHATVVLLSPVRYSSDMHQEAHEWLTFTRLAQEAYSGNPLPHSQLQKNWSGKVQSALGLPASFQEPGLVELKEEATKEEPLAPVAFEQQSRVSQVSEVSLDYPMLPSKTSLCHSQLPSQSVVSQASLPSQPSQPSSERREEPQSTAMTGAETEAQKASAASQASERDSKPGDWSPEGPKIRAEVSQAQLALTPPGSGRKLVKALSPMASQAQYTSGMVTPPPPACIKPVSPMQGARSPIAAAIEVLRDSERPATQVHSLPAGSPERPLLNGAMPPVQAMPPPRHLSPLRQIITKQVSVVPPSNASLGSAAEPALAGPGRMSPAPAPASPAAPAPAVAAPAATSVQRPSTLAVQHQQKEMQYLNNLKRHVPQQLQGTQGAPAFVRSPSPPGGRAMRSQQLGTPIQAPPMEAAQPGCASPMVPATMTSFMPQAGAMTAMSPTPMATGAATPMAGAVTPMAHGATTPMAGAVRTTYSAYPVRSDSPMAAVYQTRSLSPMARPVAVAAPVAPVAAPITAATPMRYGAFVQAQPMPVSYGAVMMQREVVRPFTPQVPVAFKVAPPMAAAQAASVTPRKAVPAEAGVHKPSRSVSPLPAGTMERVRVGRQESK